MNEITTTQDRALSTQQAKIGQIANEFAAKNVFEGYTSRKSENTLRRHRTGLTLFAKYLVHCQFFLLPHPMTDKELKKWFIDRGTAMMQSGYHWQNITYGLVGGFRKWMLNNGFSIGSVNNHLSTIRIYTRLALDSGSITAETAYRINGVSGYSYSDGINIDKKRDITRLGDKKAVSVSITTQQARKLKNQPDTPIGRRNRLIMSLLLDHGLRVSELSLLKVNDYNRDDNLLSFYRPKVKIQAIPHKLSRTAIDAMLNWLENDVVGDGCYLLRGSRKGGKLTQPGMAEQNINALVGKLGQEIGIENLSPHDCRHYCATQLAKRKSVKELMDFFGWTSASTAMRYVESTKFVETD